MSVGYPGESSMTPLVSVVIPVLNDERVFAAAESVHACGVESDSLQLVVVDNGSTAAFSNRLSEALKHRAMVISVPEPGVYVARNAAIDAANGEFVFFTDADCVVRDGWIAAGVALFREGADLVVVPTRVVDTERASLLVCGCEDPDRKKDPLHGSC